MNGATTVTRDDFTKTELAILELLSDGQHHDMREFAEISDNVYVQICGLRKKIHPAQQITCTYRNRRTGYQWTRRLTSHNDGKS